MKATSDMLIEALADALTGTSEESEILRKEVKEDIEEVQYDIKSIYKDLFDEELQDDEDISQPENATTCSPDMPEVQPVPRQPIPDMSSIFQMAHECLTNLEQATKPKEKEKFTEFS